MSKFSLIALILLFFAGDALAQHRVAFVNPQEVLDVLPERDEIERELNAVIQESEQQFEERVMEYRQEEAAYMEVAETLSSSENEREMERLMGLRQELQELQFTLESRIEERQMELLRPVLLRINNTIESVARELGYDYVLNEETSQGEPILLFIANNTRDEHNLTQEVIQRLTN